MDERPGLFRVGNVCSANFFAVYPFTSKAPGNVAQSGMRDSIRKACLVHRRYPSLLERPYGSALRRNMGLGPTAHNRQLCCPFLVVINKRAKQ